MSEVFKLKICLGEASVELEGEGNLVHSILLELREDGLGKLSESSSIQPRVELPKEDIVTPTSDGNSKEAILEQTNVPYDLPSIDTIVIKNLPKTEAEWILIYALFASDQGSKTISENDLREMYHSSGRWNESRGKNFSANLKKAVMIDWLSSVNDSTYSLLDAGISKAHEILQRVAKGGPAKKTASSPKSTYKLIELGLDEGKRQDIKQYLLSFPSVNNMDRAVLIAYKLAQFGITDFNENSIFTALRIADLPASYDLKASLTNGKGKKNFFISSDTPGMYKLHHLGEDRAKALENARGNE